MAAPDRPLPAATVPGRVSLVIPAYNYAAYLPGCLDSALAQGLDDLEIVLVDDGSTDETSEVVARYGATVRSFRQANAGLPSARNAGLDLATGEFLAFLDADDLLAPGTLASQLRFLARHPEADAAVCRSLFFSNLDQGGRPVPNGEWRLFHRDLAVHLCHFNVAPPHAFLARRAALAGLRFDPGLSACEDHAFWLGLAASGRGVAANPEAVAFYRRHAGSMSANLGRQRRHDAIMHTRIAGLLLDRPDFPPGRRRAALLAAAAGPLLTAARLAGGNPGEAARLAALAWESLGLAGAAASGPLDELERFYLTRVWYSLDTLLRSGCAGVPERGAWVRRLSGPWPESAELEALSSAALERAVEERARPLYGQTD